MINAYNGHVILQYIQGESVTDGCWQMVIVQKRSLRKVVAWIDNDGKFLAIVDCAGNWLEQPVRSKSWLCRILHLTMGIRIQHHTTPKSMVDIHWLLQGHGTKNQPTNHFFTPSWIKGCWHVPLGFWMAMLGISYPLLGSIVFFGFVWGHQLSTKIAVVFFRKVSTGAAWLGRDPPCIIQLPVNFNICIVNNQQIEYGLGAPSNSWSDGARE